MKQQWKKLGLVAGLAVAIAVAAVLLWNRYASPTRIAMVNYPEYMLAPLLDQEFSFFVRFDAVPWRENSGPELEQYDAIYFFGMGLKFSPAQEKRLESLKVRGVPLLVTASTRQETALSTLDEPVRRTVAAYLDNGTRDNIRRLGDYTRRKLDGKRLFAPEAEAPVELPRAVYFHAGENARYPDWNAFIVGRGQAFDPARPTVAVVSMGGDGDLDALIAALEAHGVNAVGVMAAGPVVDRLREVKPALVVLMPHGRLAMNDPDGAAAWLKENNIPLYCPLKINQPYEEFLADQRGMTGGMLSQSIIMPEIDGGAAPFVVAALFRNKRGLYEFRMIPERLAAFCELVTKTLNLQVKDNFDKHVAIVYYKGPGRNALVASGLEVGESLLQVLRRLKAAGYDTGELPEEAAALLAEIQQRAAVFGTYAEGAMAEFVRRNQGIRVTPAEFRDWAGRAMPKELSDSVTARYGEFPGRYLATADGSLLLGALRFGKIVLMPQPLPAYGGDSVQAIHGARIAPPYAYIATYLWIKYGFNADAMIHFGTHGSLEFTPWKQQALADCDWPDVLAKGIPHYYLYTISNPGEAIIAKRRSYATLVSHLTPPFMTAGSYGALEQLEAKLEDYQTTDENPALRSEYAKAIADLVKAEKLDREVKLSADFASGTPTAEDIAALHRYLHELAGESVTDGLYMLGRPYTPEEAETTAKLALAGRGGDVPAMAAALIASTAAELDALLNGLDGGFLAPSVAGDPIANPDSVPTGRNLYGIDPDRMPTRESFALGQGLAEGLIRQQLEATGDYPAKVAFTLWGGEFIRTQGADIGEIFYLLGVEPVWDSRGRVRDIRLIPTGELGRPRIDVVVQTSGQFRGVATDRMRLIDHAVRLAAAAPEDELPNHVAAGSRRAAEALIQAGYTPEQARKMADARLFGGVNGNFGSNITGMIQAGDRWEDSGEVGRRYLENMGAMYTEEAWGEYAPGAFAAALSGTDAVVQSRSSNTWGPLSLDHVYEFTGGLSLAVKAVTGRQPDAYFNDLRTPGRSRVQEAGQAAMAEARTTLLNPAYVKELLKEGPSAAAKFAAAFENTYGWEVTRPDMLDDRLWEEYKKMYLDDINRLGTREFFERENPYALQQMTAVMLETIRKGYWRAAPETVREIAAIHVDLVERFDPGCSGTVCDNAKLRDMIAETVADPSRYLTKVAGVREVPPENPEEVSGMRLKEERLDREKEQTLTGDRATALGIIAGVIVLVFLAVIWGRRRERSGC